MEVRASLARVVVFLCVIPLSFAAFIAVAPLASAAATITQIPPSGATTTVASSNGFTSQLNVSGNSGSVTFTQGSSTSANLSVNAAGQVLVSATLAVGGYTVSGTDSDTSADTGTWSYTLTVTGTTITQTSPTTGVTTVSASNAFNPGSIAVNNNTGAVTFVTTVTSTGLHVSGGGIITTTGPLAVGSYTVSGTDSDTVNDTGTWTYTLTVNTNPITTKTITQTSPTSGVTTTKASATFIPGPLTVTNNVGAVTFAATSTSAGLVLSGNQISTTGALSLGHYTISGTDNDPSGDTGTWTFTLTVTNAIVQTSPTSGVTTTAASSIFFPGVIVVNNNTGAVTFVTTVTSTGLHVSGGGVITTTGPLAVGSYTVSGTDSDTGGNTGTWTYTLTVSNLATTVTYNANGGKGAMKAERHNTPTALASNRFTRAGYTFVDWNTASNGSGASYSNGATYPFTRSTTLFAQWRIGKTVIHSVTFNANGGTGAMAGERENTPTGLLSNRFTRFGYAFVDWNTAANGSGASYANGATYPFTRSATLFAEWKVVKATPHTVTFNANRGKGAMAAERHNTPTALASNRFTRAGYTFVDWNTASNGSGASYANGATYPFTRSTTLFAQWRRHKNVVIPGIPATASVGPFSLKSSALSPSLEAEIGYLASTVKANRDTEILLVGYGDKLSAADVRNKSLRAANITLSQHRASSVEAYLRQRLAALGVKGYTITLQGNGAVTTAASTNQSNTGLVVATLT